MNVAPHLLPFAVVSAALAALGLTTPPDSATAEPAPAGDASIYVQDARASDGAPPVAVAPKVLGATPVAVAPQIAAGRPLSRVVYPPRPSAIRFDHATHAREGCVSCHSEATTSRRAADGLLPAGTTCDRCHGESHRAHASEKPTKRASDAGTLPCSACHLSDPPTGASGATPHLHSNHQVHAERNIGCKQCHVVARQGAEVITLPSMDRCLDCHRGDDDAEGIGASCTYCHEALNEKTGSLSANGRPLGGSLRVTFPEGNLLPPRTSAESRLPGALAAANHDADFVARHKFVAGENSALCANCHKDAFCTDCHDGRVRPRNIHPNDYLSLHATEARLRTTTCTSCHQETSFCLACHQRVGISPSSPLSAKGSNRFHPPKEIFTDLPRRPGHHAQEANRNLDACVSCHTERDCASCHGAAGRGGGFSPHPGGFAGSCGPLFARNPRPCLVCHEATSASLGRCR